MDYFKELIIGGTKKFTKEIEKEILRSISIKIKKIKKRIFLDAASMLVLLISLIFIIIAFTFFFIEYFHLTRAISFLISGIVLILIGIILKLIK